MAEKETDTTPTEKQKEAGNYKKGHVQVGTFNITIENPKGSVRSGIDTEGNKWETIMQNTYGYIRGTEGVDGGCSWWTSIMRTAALMSIR